jgi:hypothetical protein
MTPGHNGYEKGVLPVTFRQPNPTPISCKYGLYMSLNQGMSLYLGNPVLLDLGVFVAGEVVFAFSGGPEHP